MENTSSVVSYMLAATRLHPNALVALPGYPVELPETALVILPGEGSFHQFHGRITTGTQGESRVKSMDDHFDQYAALRGGPYKSPTKRPIYLGSFPDSAMKFVEHCAVQAIKAADM